MSEISLKEDGEEQRATWAIRFLYGREPRGREEIDAFKRMYSGLTNKNCIYHAIQSAQFLKEGAELSNMFIDINFRKRIELLDARRKHKVKPNFLVVGQPRAGTTSLYEFFQDHPDVYVPAVKEVNYYSHWSKNKVGPHGLNYEDYLMYFMESCNERIVCDISPFYLSEPGVSLQIFRDNPDAKILVILRNPIEIVVSKYNLDFNSNDTLEIDKWLRKGLVGIAQNEPRWEHNSGVASLFNCCVSLQLSEYKRYFGPNIKILLFDDLVNNQAKVYAEICDFIGIPFLYSKEYWAWKAPSSARPSKHIYSELTKFFSPEVNRLESVLGRKLNIWYDRWKTV